MKLSLADLWCSHGLKNHENNFQTSNGKSEMPFFRFSGIIFDLQRFSFKWYVIIFSNTLKKKWPPYTEVMCTQTLLDTSQKVSLTINEAYKYESYVWKVVLQLNNAWTPVIRITARLYFIKTVQWGEKKIVPYYIPETTIYFIRKPTYTQFPILWEDVNTGIPVSRKD